MRLTLQPNRATLNAQLKPMTQTRRAFVGTRGSCVAAALSGGQTFAAILGKAKSSYKAAIIGRTGRGDYGHGFEVVFRGPSNVSVEAIVDENPAGLKKAAKRSGAKRQYRDYLPIGKRLSEARAARASGLLTGPRAGVRRE